MNLLVQPSNSLIWPSGPTHTSKARITVEPTAKILRLASWAELDVLAAFGVDKHLLAFHFVLRQIFYVSRLVVSKPQWSVKYAASMPLGSIFFIITLEK